MGQGFATHTRALLLANDWVLTYPDGHTGHTVRQRAHAHHERATYTLTLSVRCKLPHLGAIRGYASCQQPRTYAYVRVR